MSSQSSFQVRLFKLEAITGANDEINKLLRYDFKDVIDYKGNPVSTSNEYWRNLLYNATKKEYISNEDYLGFYENKINNLLKKINEAEYSFEGGDQGIDITQYFLGFTLVLRLNNLTDAVSLEFKENDINIEDNNLIEIRENNEVIFLGFVTKKENTLDYEGFYTQKVTLLNIGKMYSISKITYNPSLAQYAIKGTVLKTPDISVYNDIFNNKNVFDIIKYLMEFFFLCKSRDGQNVNGNTQMDIEYILDNDRINNMIDFNIIFSLMKCLQLYSINILGQDFIMCSVKNGKHKAYNEGVQKRFAVYKPQIKSANQVLTDVINNALYDMYIDYNGTLRVRPPLYNYFPLGLEKDFDGYDKAFLPNKDNKDKSYFLKGNDFVITRDKILNYGYSEDNTKLEVWTDALYTWSFYGAIDESTDKPQFFMDIPAFVKYGFRNEETKNNHNTMSNKMARTLAMYYNHQVNNSSRTLTISLKTDLDLSRLKFYIGRLYYIDIPDINNNETVMEDAINTSKISTSNKGVMGYLIGIDKSYKYGEYITYNLSFNFVRNIEIVDLTKYSGQELDRLLIDIYNIVHPYGLVEKMQLDEHKNISVQSYESLKNQELQQMTNDLQNSGLYKAIPVFKTLPTIMDIIELTYYDKDTRDGIKNQQNNLSDKPNELSDDVKIIDGMLQYRSFKVKMQRFFSYNFGNDSINYNDPKYRASMFTSSVIDDLGMAEYVISLENIYNIFYNSVKISGVQNVSIDYNSNKISNILPNTVSNYQSEVSYGNIDKFDNFELLNASSGQNYAKNSDNSMVSYFGTRFPQLLPNCGVNLQGISQKLFNRIMEAEADIWDKWGQDMCSSLFYNSNNPWANTPANLPDTFYPIDEGLLAQIQVGNVSMVEDKVIDNNSFSRVHIGLYNKKNIVSTLFDKLKRSTDKLPISDILNNNNTIDEKVYIDFKLTGKHYEDAITANANKDLLINNLIFSPAFLFNMITILENNTLLAIPDEDDLINLNKIGISEVPDEIKSHKDGRAIDFFLPARSEDGNGKTSLFNSEGDIETIEVMPFIYPGLLGNYYLKDTIYEEFEDILKRYFDKIVVSKQKINFDINKLKGIKSTGVKKPYAVYIYHIEVDDKYWLNPTSEFIKVGNQNSQFLTKRT
jgi:hypothetical protein